MKTGVLHQIWNMNADKTRATEPTDVRSKLSKRKFKEISENVSFYHPLMCWWSVHDVIKNMVMQVVIKFAPNLYMAFKTIQRVSVPNLKLFGPKKTEL